MATEIGDALLVEKETPFVSTIIEDLKIITKQTIAAIESIARAAEGALGADILSGPLATLRENLAKLRAELAALGTEPSTFEQPFIVELTGIGTKALLKGLSRAERQIMKWKEKIENRLKEKKVTIAETLFGVAFSAPGRIDAVLKAQKDMQKLERETERHYKKLAKMKERLLGSKDGEDEGILERAKDNFAEMMALIQGGSFAKFQVVRTAFLDPRIGSENVMLAINRQQLKELKAQTQELREANADDGG